MPTISIKGVELSYDLNGNQPDDNGKSLILVHGAGGQKADWPIAWRSKDDITRDLGLTPKNHSNKLDEFQIYTLDLPGHGKSGSTGAMAIEDYANVVEEFIDKLNLNNVSIVGHSMGACIALTAAKSKNASVKSIVMIGGASKLNVSPAILEGLKNDFEKTVENIVKYSWHKQTGAFFKQKAIQRLINTGQEVVFNDFYSCSRFDMTTELEQIDLPVLVIASDNDRMVPLDVSKRMSDNLKCSVFVPILNCGHFQHIEQTELVAETLSNFIKCH